MRHRKKKANIQIHACILCLQAERNSSTSQMWHLAAGTALKMSVFKSCISSEDHGKKIAIAMKRLKSGKCNRSIQDQTHTTPSFSLSL